VELTTISVDGSLEFTLRDLFGDEKWKLDYLGRQWEEENLVNDEEPLLGGKRDPGQSWRKWFSLQQKK